MVMRSLLVVALVANAAYADSPKLASARAAIEAVRYDDAQRLLVEALREGGNAPAAVIEIYRLFASTAVVLERRELAEQYYRRWLALDPTAALPADVAPKIREPFIAAQAYMNAHGRLVAKVTPDRVVVVETDPLGMAVAATLGDGAPVTLDAERRAQLTGPGAAVALLDEYGNRLVELDVPRSEVVRMPSKRVPLYRRGRTWLVATAAVAAGGVVFGFLANRADDDAARIRRDSEVHSFDAYQDALDRRDRYALVANSLYVTGGLLGVATLVAYLTEPSITPVASRDSVGVVMTRSF